MPADAILVRDVTVPATTWGSRLIMRRFPRTTLHASAGGIGQGLPMAIGAQIAAPEKTVVLLCGDGGLLLNIGELAAARQEKTPLVTILFDDAGYGILRNIQNAHFEGRTIGVDLESPDFVAIARAFGLVRIGCIRWRSFGSLSSRPSNRGSPRWLSWLRMQ